MIQITFNFFNKESGKKWERIEFGHVTIQEFIETQKKLLEEDETLEIVMQTPYMAIVKVESEDYLDIFMCDVLKD